MTVRRLLQNGPHGFPLYSPAERRADLAVHLLGVAGALAGGGWLLLGPGLAQEAGTWLALLIYVLGLFGALAASAAYNLAPVGRGKELLRRLDHAMIYLLIAAATRPSPSCASRRRSALASASASGAPRWSVSS